MWRDSAPRAALRHRPPAPRPRRRQHHHRQSPGPGTAALSTCSAPARAAHSDTLQGPGRLPRVVRCGPAAAARALTLHHGPGRRRAACVQAAQAGTRWHRWKGLSRPPERTGPGHAGTSPAARRAGHAPRTPATGPQNPRPGSARRRRGPGARLVLLQQVGKALARQQLGVRAARRHAAALQENDGARVARVLQLVGHQQHRLLGQQACASSHHPCSKVACSKGTE